jgi:hypothetical protein
LRPGEFLYSVFKGSPAGLGMHLSTLRAVLAVAVAFCFQLFYMQGASSKAFVHPIRHVRLPAAVPSHPSLLMRLRRSERPNGHPVVHVASADRQASLNADARSGESY